MSYFIPGLIIFNISLLSRQGRLNTSGSSARHRSTSRDNSLNNSKFSSNSRQTRDQSYENRSNPHNRGRPLSRERYLEKTTSRSYDGLSRLSRDRSGSRERPGSINRYAIYLSLPVDIVFV